MNNVKKRIYVRPLGREHVHVATSYNNLGIAFINLGDFQQAKDNCARALHIYVRQLGPEHVHVFLR